MSGDSSGIILLPVALAAAPYVLCGLAVAGIAGAALKAGGAAVRYEQQQHQLRQQIRESGVANSIGDFRKSIKDTIAEQTRLNSIASEQMMMDLQNQRSTMQRVAEQQDVKVFRDYISNLKDAHSKTMQSIKKTQDDYNVQYRQKISENMSDVSCKINEQYSRYINELKQLQADMEAKKQRAKKIADSYIEEARSLISTLEENFDGAKFSARQLNTLNEQFNQTVEQYNNGFYESAIASAKDVSINLVEEIFEADLQKQEWENYYKLAIVLSEEVKVFAESQEVITQEIKEYAETASGKKLENEIVGVKVSEYTDKNAEGENRYDYLLSKANEIHNTIHDAKAKDLTTKQLKDCVDFIYNELYPAISSCIRKGITNMSNAFSRQNLGEEIIDFFEEHNFTFKGYAYDDEQHDKALHIGLENEASGEELIVTLAPTLVGNGDIQTHVDLKQIKGDEANEERKAYYRKCVEEVVAGNNPYAEVSIKCNEATKNKLSSDVQTRKKLRM